MLNVAIITIGDELLIGDTINTNSAWLGNKLTENKVNVNFCCTIPDKEATIINCLKSVSLENDIIITTGGLGPTNDDITKKAVSSFFRVDLIEDSRTVNRLIEYCEIKNRPITPVILEQALLPSCSMALNNNVGTAPGIFTKKNEKLYFNLPGVPREMQAIFNDNIIDILNNFNDEKQEDYMIYKSIYTTGITESEIAKCIEKIEANNSDMKFAYLPSYSGVRLRIGALNSHSNNNINPLEQVISEIKNELDTYVIKENKPILNAIFECLLSNNSTISVAESCTGGGLGSLLSDLSGSSKIFKGGFIVYSNEAKQSLLGVNKISLDNFGAVSEQVAIEMADNCRKKLDTDFAISITGIAGPTGGTKDKPVGTIWIGIADRNSVKAKKFIFLKDREANRELSKYTALSLLYRKLNYNI